MTAEAWPGRPASPGPGIAGAGPAAARPAPETARLYAADWKGFTTWCEGRGLAALPAAPATVAAFLTEAAATRGAGALGRRAAAIADRHRRAGYPSPAGDPAVTAILRAARRTATPRRAPPPRPATLARLAAACPSDLAGLRDRALLLLASAGLGRAALVGLDVEHLRLTAAGAELAIRDSGQAACMGEGGGLRHIPRAAAARPCPVRALEDWLDRSATRFGPVFRKIDRWGNVEHRRLGSDAIRRVLARRTTKRRHRARPVAR
jgi:site-specific recombinase XerD